MRPRHLPIILALGWVLTSPLPGKSDSDPIEGIWTGTITAPQGDTTEIGLEFYRAPNAELTFRASFPDMFIDGAALGQPVETDHQGHYRTPDPFNMSLRLHARQLSGTFGTAKLPLTLSRSGTLPRPARRSPHTPAPATLWKFPLGAGTWASPVVDGNIIYIGTNAGSFHAVDSRNGTGVWTWSGTTPIDGLAALDGRGVYFFDRGFNLVALDRATGLLLWRIPLYNEFLAGGSAPENPTFNRRCASPLLHEGTLYIGSGDGGLYAVDPTNGSVLWRHVAGAPVYSGIGLNGTDTLMFGTMDGSVILLDRNTRHELLRVKTGGGVVTTPLVVEDRLIVGSRDYQLYAFNLSDGSVAWNFSYWFSWIESTPALRDGLLYVGGSDYARVTAIDPATGRSVWSRVVHGMTWGTPLCVEGYVFAGTVNQNLPGTLINHEAGLIKLDRQTGAVLWRLELPPAAEGGFAGYAGSLARAGDRVIAAGLDGYLVAYPVN